MFPEGSYLLSVCNKNTRIFEDGKFVILWDGKSDNFSVSLGLFWVLQKKWSL